jgi:transposase
MIAFPASVHVWLAAGRTDMRRGMNGLALQVQQALGRDPHAGDLYVFRGARGDLLKILWHDGIGMSLYAKRLEHGRFVWPSPANGVVALSAAQLAYMLDGIDVPAQLCRIIASSAFSASATTEFVIPSPSWMPTPHRSRTISTRCAPKSPPAARRLPPTGR